MHHAHQRGALCAHADTWKSPFSVAISCPQAAHYLGAAKTATAQYWTLCLRKVLKAKFAATKGEACIMRSSAVRCARTPNLEIAFISGDFLPAGGASPWRRQDGGGRLPAERVPAGMVKKPRARSNAPRTGFIIS